MTELTELHKRLTELLIRPDDTYDRSAPGWTDVGWLGPHLRPDLSQLKALIEAKGWQQHSGHELMGELQYGCICFRVDNPHSIETTADSELEAVLLAAIAMLEAEHEH